MIHNERMMGEHSGFWFGEEVERTQFYGASTVFISRMSVASGPVLHQLADGIEHVFFAPINPRFFDRPAVHAGTKEEWEALYVTARELLDDGKFVSFEVLPSDASRMQITMLRVAYPTQFCALIAVEVPKLEIGGFAIKAVPSVVFQQRRYEGCVMTVPFEHFKRGATYWTEYAGDTEEKTGT
jgi:hypothetical protein